MPVASTSGGTATTSTGAPATNANSVPATEKNFFTEVLMELGDPVTQANLNSLYSVAQLEWGSVQDTVYNPLNSTVQVGNSTTRPGNTAGVQNYSSFDEGVAATVQLLQGSRWTNVQSALKSGGSTPSDLSAFEATYATWGSKVNFTTTPNSADASSTVGPNPGSGAVIDGVPLPQNGTGTFSGLLDWESIVSDAWGDFTSASFWIRIGFVVVGGIMLLIAVDKLTGGAISSAAKDTGSIEPDSAPAATPGSSTSSVPKPDNTESGRHQAGTGKSYVSKGSHSAKGADTSAGSTKPVGSHRAAVPAVADDAAVVAA